MMPGPDWNEELKKAMENAELEASRKDAIGPLLQISIVCNQFRKALINGGWSDSMAEAMVFAWFTSTIPGAKK